MIIVDIITNNDDERVYGVGWSQNKEKNVV